jgi:transposase
MLREHLDNQVAISDLSDRFNVSPAMIYYWKKQLFEGAVTLFKNNKKDQFKFKELQDKLKEKDTLIAEIVADNIRLKKKLTGDS